MSDIPEPHTVKGSWDELEAVTSLLPGEALKLGKSMFYAGYMAAVRLMEELADADLDESDFVGVMNALREELDQYGQDVIEGKE